MFVCWNFYVNFVICLCVCVVRVFLLEVKCNLYVIFQTFAQQMEVQMTRTGPPPIPEVDPFQMQRFEAAFFIRDIDISLLRQAFFTFRSAPDWAGVYAMLAAFIIQDDLFRMLSLEADRKASCRERVSSPV